MRKALVALLAGITMTTGGSVGLLLTEDQRSAPAPRAEPSPAQPSPYATRGPLLAAGRAGALPTTEGLERALHDLLGDPRLGDRLSLAVLDVGSGRTLLDVRGTREAVPASTAKLATAAAALAVLPHDRRLTTTVVAGERPGDVVLVGGGDPTLGGRLADADHRGGTLAELARQVKAVHPQVRRVLVDDGLFEGPGLGPGWKQGYVDEGSVAPVSALAVDEGRASDREGSARVPDPALEAGRQLGRLLGVDNVEHGSAPKGAKRLAVVRSEPIHSLVEQMLTRSDNDLAEALGRHVALARKQPASFEGEARAIANVLVRLGVRLDLVDASGLSRDNRVRPKAVAELLARVAPRPGFGPLLSGLPVAGFDGTLSERYRTGPAATGAGEVRAKTGTLDGVNALAGYVRTSTGRLLAFDVTADRVSAGGGGAAARALDRLAATLAECGCT